MTKTTEQKQIAFFAAEPVEITGYAQECDCSHCGRPLKVGIKLVGFVGVFGADCLAKAAASQSYYGKKWRYDAATLRERGIIAGRVGRLRGYGNAIVAQAAQVFIESYISADTLRTAQEEARK